MAEYVKIRIRRDSSEGWANNDVVLDLGEIGADIDKRRLKVGDGTHKWSELDWYDKEEILDMLTSTRSDAALSANQGRVLAARIETTKSELERSIANHKAEMNELTQTFRQFGTFGMGYTIDEADFNAFGRPTKITFEDGVIAYLNWSGARLLDITSSTGEVITMQYTASGLIKGRTVSRTSG